MNTESGDAAKLHKNRLFSYKLMDKYHQKFIDKRSGRLKKEYMKYRKCPVCSTDDYLKIFDKSGGTYVKCKSCTMVYTNPVGKNSTISAYYGNMDNGQKDITENENKFYEEIYGLGLKAISKFRRPGKILDIGCSTGFFLDVARKKKWNTYGIEIAKSEAKVCMQKNHRLYMDTIENVNFDTKFDAITLWDVFEHIPNGKKYLRMLKNILVENGVIFMQIPNSDALAAKIMREDCRMFSVLEHTNLYNKKTINLIAKTCGYRVAHLETVISEIAVMNNYLSYTDPYLGTPDYSNNKGLLGIIDERLIHKNFLGYKFQVVITPK